MDWHKMYFMKNKGISCKKEQYRVKILINREERGNYNVCR